MSESVKQKKAHGKTEQHEQTDERHIHARTVDFGFRPTLDFLGNVPIAHCRNHDHTNPHKDEDQAGQIAGILMYRNVSDACRFHGKAEHQIKALDQKAKSHNGNGSSHPREEGSFVGRMIGKIWNHSLDHLPKNGRTN